MRKIDCRYRGTYLTNLINIILVLALSLLDLVVLGSTYIKKPKSPVSRCDSHSYLEGICAYLKLP